MYHLYNLCTFWLKCKTLLWQSNNMAYTSQEFRTTVQTTSNIWTHAFSFCWCWTVFLCILFLTGSQILNLSISVNAFNWAFWKHLIVCHRLGFLCPTKCVIPTFTYIICAWTVTQRNITFHISEWCIGDPFRVNFKIPLDHVLPDKFH